MRIAAEVWDGQRRSQYLICDIQALHTAAINLLLTSPQSGPRTIKDFIGVVFHRRISEL